jgi:pyruvate dehydrogenase E1 component
MKRMYCRQENVFYYVTVMNENYPQPDMPAGVEEGIVRGMYLLREGSRKKKRVQLLGSGTILREVIAAAELLESDWGVAADVWSVTSFNELSREGADAERWNRLHPEEPARAPYVATLLAGRKGPAIAATDYIRGYAEQLRPYVDRSYTVLGTDGFGRSDVRAQLRRFFEVDRHNVALAALSALARGGELEPSVVSQAIRKYRIDPEKPNPAGV